LLARQRLPSIAFVAVLGAIGCRDNATVVVGDVRLEERCFLHGRLHVLVPNDFVVTVVADGADKTERDGSERVHLSGVDRTASMEVMRAGPRLDRSNLQFDAPKDQLLKLVFDGMKNGTGKESIRRDEVVTHGNHEFRVMEVMSHAAGGARSWLIATATKKEMFMVSFDVKGGTGDTWDAVGSRVIDSARLSD
jgi:hypothetical protein